MRRAGAVLAGCAMVLVLSGCSREFGGSELPSGETNEDPSVLRTKIGFLQADECYKGNLEEVFPHCAKFVTQLDSTTGTVDQLLADTSAAAANAAKQLRSGVDSYQRLGCDVGDEQPSQAQQRNCPAALRTIKESLRVLGSG